MRIRLPLLTGAGALLLVWYSAGRPSPVDRKAAASPAQAPRELAFRVVFGYLRRGPETFDGTVSVTGGRLVGLEPWRFFNGDAITGPASWRLSIKRGPIENQPDRPVSVADGAAPPYNLVPAGLVVRVQTGTASATFNTRQGNFTVPVRVLAWGAVRQYLGGDVIVERVPAAFEVSTGPQEQHDYPSLAVTRSGAVWIAWQAYRDRGDHVYARALGGPPERLNDNKADVFGTAIAEDGDGHIHVVWSERAGEDWNLWECVRSAAGWSAARRLTDGHSPNLFHKLVAGPSGALWLVWVGYDGGQSYLYCSRWQTGAWSTPRRIGGPSVWAPDAAVTRDGSLAVGWDGYASGNYDVYFCLVSAGGDPGPVERVAGTPRFEAHASVAVDGANRVWLAWDESNSNWGKDWTHEDQNRGTTLYAGRNIRVAVRTAGAWKQAGEFSAAVPERSSRYAELPHLAVDGAGRVWVLFQVRTSTQSTHDDVWATGGLWDLYLTTCDAAGWRPAAFVPHSNARPEVPFRIAGARNGIWMVWPTDGMVFRGRPGTHELPSMRHYDLFAAYAPSPPPAGAPVLTDLEFPVVRPQMIHPHERADVARIRGYRATVGGVTYRILRGDFHRHTAISYDGAGDGSLNDYYRYMLDAASMDTGIIGDHNMGGDVEYNWWRTEKSYDVFHIRDRFTPLFGYERSVKYPNGHRNVVFDHRGVPTLPVGTAENQGRVSSGPILFPYLRQNRGICMDHSMATGQGTDYRDNDPDLEPLVEIYQGYHASYEYAGAPRAENPSRILALHGPYEPKGFWWNALAKGLKLGVEASSDHISTHVSYAMIYTPGTGRTEIVESMRHRHAYAATDNIVVDFEAGQEGGPQHLMGEEFACTGRPLLHVKVLGTAPITAVELIRDNQFVYTQRPGQTSVDFTYTDQSPRPGENWYYIRVTQEDGNLAWSSPVWIQQR